MDNEWFVAILWFTYMPIIVIIAILYIIITIIIHIFITKEEMMITIKDKYYSYYDCSR